MHTYAENMDETATSNFMDKAAVNLCSFMIYLRRR